MCEVSSSVLVGNTSYSDFVNEAGNEVDPANAEDEYRIDGMVDIGRVRFDLLNGDENLFDSIYGVAAAARPPSSSSSSIGLIIAWPMAQS
ncbi:hypothetical protein RIF29_14741 [Crotalaria pallida]|uniref:Uncharacterized protein n=1 Tax=Crotalaria pallida TaxID=3830 RepID=A0AAN9IBY0_CROPI